MSDKIRSKKITYTDEYKHDKQILTLKILQDLVGALGFEFVLRVHDHEYLATYYSYHGIKPKKTTKEDQQS